MIINKSTEISDYILMNHTDLFTDQLIKQDC